MRRTLVDHRLDREHHPFLQARIRHPGPEVIRHLRILMQLAADAMTGKIRHHRKAGILGRALHRARDIADAIADARLLDAGVQRLRASPASGASRSRKPCRSRPSAPRRHNSPGTTTPKSRPTISPGLSLRPAFGNSVHDLLVNRHAQAMAINHLTRLIALEGRLAPFLQRQFFRQLVEFERLKRQPSPPRPTVEDLGHDPARLAHHGDFVALFSVIKPSPYVSPKADHFHGQSPARIRCSISSGRPIPSICSSKPNRP